MTLGVGLFGKRARERVLAPPDPVPGEHVLWDSPEGNKRVTFKVRGEDSYALSVYTRMDALGGDDNEPGLTRAEVLKIVAQILHIMADADG